MRDDIPSLSKISVYIVAFAAFLYLFPLNMGAKKMSSLTVTSPAFKHGQSIPERYSCKGKEVSPALVWAGVPAETKSFVLICDDPDAPGGTWVHWVVYNLPADVRALSEGVDITSIDGTVGSNSWGSEKPGYGGPCPPSGTHRYFFKLYALDSMLALAAGAPKDAVEKAMHGHVIAQGQLMGTFSKA